MSHDSVLAMLKKDVRSLLISSKLGLDPDQLRRDYANMLGYPMPLKRLGFRNVMDMVKEMPDVVSVSYKADGSIYLKAVSDEATENMVELVSKQRTSKTDKNNSRGRFRSFPSRYHWFAPVVLPRRGPAPRAAPAHLRMQLRQLLSRGPVRLSDLELSYLCCFGCPLRVHDYGFYSTGEMLEAVKDLVLIHQGRLGSLLTLREPIRPFSSFRRPVPTKAAAPLSDRPASQVSNTNTAETTKPSAEVLVRESLWNQPETTLDPVCKESAVSSKPELEEELRQEILENGVGGTVSWELKEKLRKVVGQSRGGLSIHALPDEYKKLFGEDLPFLESGFFSVTELISALSDTFVMKPAEGDSGPSWTILDIKDCDKTQLDSEETEESSGKTFPVKSSYFSLGESPWEVQQGDDDGVTEENENLESSNIFKTQEMMSETYPVIEVCCRSIVPVDALQNERLKPPTRHKAREVVEVLVEEVESPGNFYIRFCENKEARALEDMMFEMRRCYTCPEVSERYHLVEPFIRQGQVCCVSPSGMWFYRVVIHRVLNSTQVEVYYVDYGNITVVPKDKLKFLKSSFLVLPAQAVPSSLAGIQPTSGIWTHEATASFRKLCPEHAIVGALNHYTGDVLQLYLCDTHTDQDIYVHSVLISQGHGVACSSGAAAALCNRVTPVSLYFGKGMVDLPEVDKELILSFTLDTPEQSLEASQIQEEEDEVPGLELIEENEVIPHIQGGSSFTPLVKDQTFNGGEQSRTSADTAPPTSTSTTSPAAAPSHPVQAGTHPAHCGTEPQVEIMTPPPTPSKSESSSFCSQDEVPPKDSPSLLFQPPLLLRSFHTPCLGQIPNSPQGVPVFHPYQRNFGPSFPLFGARLAPTPKLTE